MTQIDHIHRETRVPVKNPCKLFTAQFAASIHDPNHHCNDQLAKPTFKRKETFFTFAQKCETYEVDIKIPKCAKYPV